MMINDLLDTLDVVQGKIKSMDVRIEDAAMNDEDVHLLETVPSVGHIMATVIKAEAGGLHRFGSADQLASYAGLAPTIRQSGEARLTSAACQSEATRACATCSLMPFTFTSCSARIPS